MSETVDFKKKLEELQTAFATAKAQITEIKANPNVTITIQDLHNVCNSFDYMISNLSERISYLSNAFYDYTYQHSKGHLPAIKTTTQMEKALKSIGMEGDFEVAKPYISVANTTKGATVLATYVKK